jgi:hypothetical protein
LAIFQELFLWILVIFADLFVWILEKSYLCSQVIKQLQCTIRD